MGEQLVNVHLLDDQTDQSAIDLWSLVYNGGEPLDRSLLFYRACEKLVAQSEGHVRGCLVIWPMNLRVRGQILKGGGIGAVAVAPEARGQGVGTHLMAGAVRHQQANGHVFSLLYPFRESFYRRVGYEVFGTRWEIEISNASLPRTSCDLPIRRLAISEAQDELDRVHESYSRRYSGIVVRDSIWWERLARPDKLPSVYLIGEPAEGYMVVKHDARFWEKQEILEIAYSSKRGMDGVLGLLATIGINKTAVKFLQPAENPIMMTYREYGIKPSEEKPVMARLINLERFISSLNPPTPKGGFTFRLIDDQLADQNGTWKISWEDKVTAIRSEDAPDFEIHVRQFSQAALGEPSLSSLAE